MKRTPEEERIFRALAQIETPEADLSAALPAGGGAAPHPARPSPGGGGCAVRPADHRRGGGGLFRGVAVLCPLPAPERRADRGGQARPPGTTPSPWRSGGGRQQFYAPAGPDPGGRRAYRSRGIADHQQHGSGSNGGRPLFWPRHPTTSSPLTEKPSTSATKTLAH